MTLRSSRAAASSVGQRGLGRRLVAPRPPGADAVHRLHLDRLGHGQDRALARRSSGDGSVSVKRLTPTTICSPASIAASAARVRLDQRALQAPVSTAAIAPPMASMRASSARAASFSSSTLASITRRAVEDVAVFEQVGLVGEDLLHAHRPLLVPGARQAERLVPGRQLHGAGARLLRQRHGQHLDAGCDRRCSRAAARSGPASSPARRSGSTRCFGSATP